MVMEGTPVAVYFIRKTWKGPTKYKQNMSNDTSLLLYTRTHIAIWICLVACSFSEMHTTQPLEIGIPNEVIAKWCEWPCVQDDGQQERAMY